MFQKSQSLPLCPPHSSVAYDIIKKLLKHATSFLLPIVPVSGPPRYASTSFISLWSLW